MKAAEGNIVGASRYIVIKLEHFTIKGCYDLQIIYVLD
jgi:hypothetical protein